jgi:hypothetical protein
VGLNDGKLEILEVASTIQLAASIVSLTTPKILGSSGKIRISIDTPEFDMQVDGEPWIQRGPCVLDISFHSQALMLRTDEAMIESRRRTSSSWRSFTDDPS